MNVHSCILKYLCQTAPWSGSIRVGMQVEIEMAFPWRADNDSTLNSGLVFRGSGPVLLRNPNIFVIIQKGAGSGSLSFPLVLRMTSSSI